jgi:hypothetical protein
MAWSIDARIPVTLLPDPAALPAALADGRAAALVAEGEAPPDSSAKATEAFTAGGAHAAACACCAGRSGAALALDRLFQARARGTARWFDRVLVLASSDAARAELAQALATDALTRARYRAG